MNHAWKTGWSQVCEKICRPSTRHNRVVWRDYHDRPIVGTVIIRSFVRRSGVKKKKKKLTKAINNNTSSRARVNNGYLIIDRGDIIRCCTRADTAVGKIRVKKAARYRRRDVRIGVFFFFNFRLRHCFRVTVDDCYSETTKTIRYTRR